MSEGTEVAVYECSGIRVASPIALPAPRVDDADANLVDLIVELAECRVPPPARPSDDLVAELVVGGFVRYSICRVDGGYVCRVFSVGDFFLPSDLSRVECYPAVEGRNEIIAMVITGTITAFVLSMKGCYVLHGSAVEMGMMSMAFVGPSGQGKSTMAALFCAVGARLVTDDVLPLDFGLDAAGGQIVHCLRSGSEIRLREKSASLIDRFDEKASVRITADKRHAIRPMPSGLDRVPLAAIVLPKPDREHPDVRARLVETGEASLRLDRCQRIEGWHDRDHLRRHFVETGQVVETVPVYEVSVPWGPPFADDLAQRILSECGLTDTFQDSR